MENKHIRTIIEVFVLASMLTATVVYHEAVAGMSLPLLALLTVSAIMALLLITAATSWLYSQPSQILRGIQTSVTELSQEGKVTLGHLRQQGNQLHSELKTTLTQTLEAQPYVSEDMLAIIEENADTIWVVSTDLRNDVTPGRIQESVSKNLDKGKYYTYFVPAPTNPNFPNAAQNERAYRNWQVYRNRSNQIRFIHLPDNTLFLFREVVIYNPLPDPNASIEKAAKGFTYFDTIIGSGDRLMKIPDTYLEFLKGQLHRYAEDVGLTTEVERLLREHRAILADAEKAFLANLIGEARIGDLGLYRNFVAGVRARDERIGELLSLTLSQYLERVA